jgi:predicted nucleic acid-binding protein
VFSALLSKENICKFILVSNKFEIYSCNFLFVEIFKHKKKIQAVSKLNENDLLFQLEKIINKINLVSDDVIPQNIYNQAYQLCKDIDKNDIPFVALTQFLNGKLLTGDKKLFEGLKTKSFDVIGISEIVKLI